MVVVKTPAPPAAPPLPPAVELEPSPEEAEDELDPEPEAEAEEEIPDPEPPDEEPALLPRIESLPGQACWYAAVLAPCSLAGQA